MLDKLWKFFASLRPLAFIFTSLVISILIGSFVIQRFNADEGQIERAYSPETIKIFEFFGFFDLFHSPWFVFLVFLLGVNVICASIEMWPRHVKLAKTVDPELSESALKNQAVVAEFELTKGTSHLSAKERFAALLKKHFKTPQILEKDGKLRFFVNKMRFGYFGVYVVHTGLIIIMIGGIIGSIDGYEGQMALMEGESSSKILLRKTTGPRRNKVLDFSVKCHGIHIETYENGSTKDYFSDLEVFDKDGRSVVKHRLQVNEPLTYGGVSFYQASYGKQKVNEEKFYNLKMIDRKTRKVTDLKISEDAEKFQIPGTQKTITVTNYHENPQMPGENGLEELGETIRFELSSEGKTEFVTVFKDYPEVDGELRPKADTLFAFTGMTEEFELKEITGLQASRDPGAPIVFTGCAVLMIGIFWAFFTSHQKIWLVVDGAKVLVAGRTYRNPVSFKAKFGQLVAELKADAVSVVRQEAQSAKISVAGT